MAESFHGPWKGESKIILSIDIGITHSGVSFAYLENGAKQTIHPVTKWPGQEAASMESMVPTMVWYDANNKAVAFGAESLSHHIEEQAKVQGWFLAKNFKAHLYPEDMEAQHNPRISALPFGASLRQVYSDFLGYLLKHTKSYFEERTIEGVQIWERYQSAMEIVMSHPYGWGARERSFLQDAVVSAGYTTPDLAPRNIRFVTDPEASSYCCLSHASLTKQLQTEDTFILCDAGNTTTSISLHKVESTKPILNLKTLDLKRLQGGATSIDAIAETYMRKKFTNAGISLEDIDDFTRAGIEDFRKRVKFAFNDETKEHLIQIANVRFNNSVLSIRRGRMALPGSVIKSFFVDYVEAIRQAIDQRAAESNTHISHVLLVGCFAGSSYLQQVVNELCESRGYQIALAANSTSRASVDGALIRDTKLNNGIKPRRSIGIETSCGSWLGFTIKGTVIHPGTEIKKPVSLKYATANPNFNEFELKFLSYNGEIDVTRTKDTKGVLLDGFTKWFTFSANLNALSQALVQRLDTNNVVHWRLNFNVCVRFEEEGLEAYIEWEEKGGTRHNPATIRPDYEF